MRLFHFTSFALLYMMCTVSLADEIKIFTWEGYISPNVIDLFEKQTGHTVKLFYYESETLRDSVVSSEKAKAYDLFLLDSDTLSKLIEKTVLRELSASKIGLSEYFLDNAEKACGQYGIPYSYGVIGIGYRSNSVSMNFDSWMEVFRYATQFPSTVVIPDEDIDTVAIALMALGYHPMTNDETELKAAYKLLANTRSSLLAFRNSAGYALDKRKLSKMQVAVFYSGEKHLIAKNTEQEDWVFTVPNNGTLVWHDCISAPEGKSLTSATLSFIQFINKPNNAITNAQEMWFATPNKKALELASDEYLNDNDLFLKNNVYANSFQYEELEGHSLLLRSKIISILSNY